jgi:hypothetical protein
MELKSLGTKTWKQIADEIGKHPGELRKRFKELGGLGGGPAAEKEAHGSGDAEVNKTQSAVETRGAKEWDDAKASVKKNRKKQAKEMGRTGSGHRGRVNGQVNIRFQRV